MPMDMKGPKLRIFALLGILLLPIGSFLFVLFKPEVIINQKNIELVLKKFPEIERKISWSNLEFELHSESLWEKRVDFAANDFCWKDETLKFCSSEIKLRAWLLSFPWNINNFEVDYARIQSAKIELYPSKQEEKKKSDSNNTNLILDSSLLKSIFPSILWKNEIGKLRADLNVLIHNQDGERPERIDLVIKGRATNGLGKYNLEAESTQFLGWEKSQLKATLIGEVKKHRNDLPEISVDVRMSDIKKSRKINANLKSYTSEETSSGLPFTLVVNGNTTKNRFDLNTKGIITDHALEGEISGETTFIGKNTLNIKVDTCTVTIPYPTQIETSLINCKSVLSAKIRKINPQKKSASIQVPLELSTESSSMVHFKVPETENEIFSIGLDARAPLYSIVHNPLEAINDAKISGSFITSDFQGLQNVFEPLDLYLPAPFSALGGKVAIYLQKLEADDQGSLTLLTKIETDLRSMNQELLTESSVKTKFDLASSRVDLKADFVAKQVKLVLPRVAPTEVPKLEMDERFSSSEKLRKDQAKDLKPKTDQANSVSSNDKPPFSFFYEVEVSTAKPGALKLKTQLIKEDIPISVDLRLKSNSAPQGRLQIERMETELFGRNALIESLRIDLAPEIENSEVNGQINVRYIDYKIEGRITGTVQQPHLSLLSDPPLSQKDIYSVLLFGETYAETDSSESSSVTNTQAAMADRAIGLASIAMLASTPIERVGYDPNNKNFSARLRLSQGTSLTVGSDFETSSSVMLRRKIGQNFELSTGLEREAATEESSFSGFLDWIRRY